MNAEDAIQKSRISYADHMIWSRLRELEKEGAIVRTNFRPARFRRGIGDTIQMRELNQKESPCQRCGIVKQDSYDLCDDCQDLLEAQSNGDECDLPDACADFEFGFFCWMRYQRSGVRK